MGFDINGKQISALILGQLELDANGLIGHCVTSSIPDNGLVFKSLRDILCHERAQAKEKTENE